MRAALVTAAAALVALGLAGCASRVDAPLSPAFGSALAAMNVQIIDPTPASGPPSTSAAKAANAIERYERDRVKDPGGAYAQTSGGAGEDRKGSDRSNDSSTGSRN
jgi:hypothetical protein